MSIVTIITVIGFSGALMTIIPSGEVIQKLIIVSLSFSVIAIRKCYWSRRSITLIWPFMAYLVIATFSAFFYSASIVYTLAAVHSLLFGLIFYVWAINLNLRTVHITSLRRLTYVVILVQFIFALIKLVVHGVDEKMLIGTMSHTAGQFGFLFPAIAVPLLIFMMRKKNTLMTYLLVAAMFLFGIINEKRAIIFLLPVILLASILVNHTGSAYNNRRFWRMMLGGGIIAISGVAIGISAIPSLNPGEGYGSDFSIIYAFNYAVEYLTMDFGGPLQGSYLDAATNINIQVGRVILWMSIVDWFGSVDSWTLLFGTGFGTATPSIWLQEGSDYLFDIIGTRGAISGAGLAAVETGLVGLLIIGYLFIHVFQYLVNAHRRMRSLTARRWFRTLMIVHLVFCFDFFFYSTTLLRTLPMPLIFFATLASISLVNRLDDEFVRRETTMLNPG